MRSIIYFLSAFLFLLPGPTASAQWCQRISADYLAPGVNIGLTQNDGSQWVAGLYRGFLEIPGPAGPVQFTSSTSGDVSEYRYTGYIARYLPDGSLAWAKEIRSNFNRMRIQQLTAVPDGSVVVVGSYSGPIVFNLGETDQFVLQGTNESVFMARFQANGSLMWAKALTGNGLFFQDVSFAHWHNNELYLAVRLNNGDIDFDPGSGTTRLFAPFLLANQQNYCYGRYTATGDFMAAGVLFRGPFLSIGQPQSIGQKLALPLTFSDTVQLFMGQITAAQTLRASGIHGAVVLSSDLTNTSAIYQTVAASINDSTTGFLVDMAVIGDKIHQIIGVGLGTVQLNPNNPNDTITNLSGSNFTHYEVVLDSQANYLSYRLISSFTGPTAIARYARGTADSMLVLFGAPGFTVNGITYNSIRSTEQMAGVLRRDAAGFAFKKSVRAIQNAVPALSVGGGHSYLQVRWQDSLFFDQLLYHQAPQSRQFIEVCKMNDNGISLGNATIAANRQAVRLYPKPASTTLQLALQSATPTQIRLLDVQGREVYRKQLVDALNVDIDVHALPAGLYFCRWESAGQLGHIKWIKQ